MTMQVVFKKQTYACDTSMSTVCREFRVKGTVTAPLHYSATAWTQRSAALHSEDASGDGALAIKGWTLSFRYFTGIDLSSQSAFTSNMSVCQSIVGGKFLPSSKRFS